MFTSETLESIRFESESHLSRPKTVENLTTPSEDIAFKLKNQPTEKSEQLPGQIEESLSESSTRNEIPINYREAMKPSNSNRNNSGVKVEETEQKKIYEKCMKFIGFFGMFIGVRMAYDWKPQSTLLFLMFCFCTTCCGFSILYTGYIHCVNGDYIRILEPLAVAGLEVSVYLKLYAFAIHWKQVIALVFSIRGYIRSYVYGRKAEILKACLRKNWTLLLSYTFVIISAILFYAFTPIMVFFTKHEVVPLVSLEIIFCNQSQTSGFVVATIAHLAFATACALSIIVYGIAFIFCISIYIIQGSLIGEDFRELDEMWNGVNNIPVEHKQSFLKNICKKRQDMNDFLKIVQQVYEKKFFLYFCSSYFSQIICLYHVTQNDWIGGYGPALGASMEMMFYCYMGTQISIVDDRLSYFIYTCNWYEYDLESQRTIILLLHECQQSKELKVGFIGPLNMVTGITIVKSIYYYYTVLTELL